MRALEGQGRIVKGYTAPVMLKLSAAVHRQYETFADIRLAPPPTVHGDDERPQAAPSPEAPAEEVRTNAATSAASWSSPLIHTGVAFAQNCSICGERKTAQFDECACDIKRHRIELQIKTALPDQNLDKEQLNGAVALLPEEQQLIDVRGSIQNQYNDKHATMLKVNTLRLLHSSPRPSSR